LLVHTDGKRTYVPTLAYREKRKDYLRTRAFRGKPDTKENCFRLLDSIHKLLVAHRRRLEVNIQES